MHPSKELDPQLLRYTIEGMVHLHLLNRFSGLREDQLPGNFISSKVTDVVLCLHSSC